MIEDLGKTKQERVHSNNTKQMKNYQILLGTNYCLTQSKPNQNKVRRIIIIFSGQSFKKAAVKIVEVF